MDPSSVRDGPRQDWPAAGALFDGTRNAPLPGTALSAECLLRHAGWYIFFLLLAPILGPRDYGLCLFAASGIAIVEGALSQTVSQALLGLRVAEEGHFVSAFLAAVNAGGAVSVLLYLVSGLIPAMFDDPTFGDLFQSLSFVPLLVALAAVPNAALRRAGRGMPLLIASWAGILVGGVIAVRLARVGAGAWSLVAQLVAQRFVEVAILWCCAARTVGFGWSRRHFGDLVATLDRAALAGVCAAVARQATYLIVGVVLGPVAVGLYLVGTRLFDAVCDLWLLPLELHRPGNDAAWVGDLFRSASGIVLPALLGAASLPLIVPAVLDARWWGAVVPAQIFLLASVPAAAIAVRRAVLASAGWQRVETRFALAETLSGVVVVLLAAPYGLTVTAAAVALQVTIVAAASLRPIGRTLGGDWRDTATAVRPLALTAAVVGVVAFGLAEAVGSSLTPLSATVFLIAVGCVAHVALRAWLWGTRPVVPLFLSR